MAEPDDAGKALLGIISTGDTIPQVPQFATKAEFIATINRLVDAHNRELVLKVYSDAGYRRFMIGYQKDGWGSGKDFGIKLSKVGFDVLTAADADLLFKLAY